MPGLAMVNMEQRRKCSRLILLNILETIPEIPVMCYSPESWIVRGVFNSYRNRLMAMTYEGVVQGLKEYIASVRDGDPVSCFRLPAEKINHSSVLEKVDRLSPRELEILCLMGQGHGVLEASDIIDIGCETVKSHLKGIRRKLNLNGIIAIRYLAASYARTGECQTFFSGNNHICQCRGKTMGSSPVRFIN